jgi:hypothetical protein
LKAKIEARDVFERYFPQLGQIQKIILLDFPSQNVHFYIETYVGRYFLKKVLNADSFFGSQGNDRLEWVANATFELRKSHLPVETLIPTADGRCCIIFRQAIFRLYKFIETKESKNKIEQILQGSRSLAILHSEGLNSISEVSAINLNRIATPYSYLTRINRIDEIRTFVKNYSGDPKIRGKLLEIYPHLNLLRQLVLSELQDLPDERNICLLHCDAHPSNVMFQGNNAILIDLDNMHIGPVGRCISFFLMRFGWFNDRTTNDSAVRMIDLALREYQRHSNIFPRNPYLWMKFIEVEKILRILTRFEKTGLYSNYLNNIISKHIPSIRRLNRLTGTACT